MTIRGETQKLEDSVVLKELCAAEVEVGRLPVSVEIHLELSIKEIVFPSWTLSKVRLGESGSPWRRFFIAKVHHTGRPVRSLRRLHGPNKSRRVKVISVTHIYGTTEYMI